jgi:hypothetical protein
MLPRSLEARIKWRRKKEEGITNVITMGKPVTFPLATQPRNLISPERHIEQLRQP